MGSVTLRGIRKAYGAVEVLHGIDLDVREGDFTVLVGPSGCGKSTLLRAIAGLETIGDGEIALDGQAINHLPPKRRNIAMVFQNYALYPHMSVARNMGFSLRLARRPKEEIDRKVREAAEILGLTDLLERYPRQLSGGQRQRVAMGRAIVRDPALFLFDEPLSNLDAKLRVQMRTEIKALHQKLRSTIVYVTHDQIEAMTMADRIVVMEGGRIAQVGRPLEIYDRPANLFVAGFIGSPSMTLLPAETGEGGVSLADGTLLAAGAPAGAGRRVIAGIRPEMFAPDPGGPVALAVEVVEPTGPETHVFGKIAGTDVRVVLRTRLIPDPGETIRLSVPENEIALFDPDSGERL